MLEPTPSGAFATAVSCTDGLQQLSTPIATTKVCLALLAKPRRFIDHNLFAGLATMSMIKTTLGYVYGYYTLTQWNGNYNGLIVANDYKNFIWRYACSSRII